MAHVGSDDDEQPQTKPTNEEKEELENGNDIEEVPGSDEGEDEEEEYEIEEILDAKKGMFAGGRVGYLVKWKGYTDEHNSWVDEKDAGNAQDLIDAYWKKKKDKTRRKSTNEIKPPAKDRRKSINVSDDESLAKKRGRPSKSRADTEEDARVTKKAKKATNKNGTGREAAASPDEEMIGNMKDHMHMSDWEPFIRSVDTVVKTDQGLEVYFTLNSGERVKEDSKICRERFPQKLISFYETHLKWREVEEDADS